MKNAVIAGLAFPLLSTLVSGAPTYKRTDTVTVEFQAAANTGYTQDFPLNGVSYDIKNDPSSLSISHIVVHGNADCTFYGIGNGATTVGPNQLVDVGPPQNQLRGSCTPASSTPPPSNSPVVTLEFQGATPDAQYQFTVPVDGTNYTIPASIDPNHLNISHIQLLDPQGAQCTFFGTEGSTTTIYPVPATADVGPPQPQLQGYCLRPNTGLGRPSKRQGSGREVEVLFQGATPDASFTYGFQATGQTVETIPDNIDPEHLSVSYVSITAGTHGTCTRSGVGDAVVAVVGNADGLLPVGPPQAIYKGICA